MLAFRTELEVIKYYVCTDFLEVMKTQKKSNNSYISKDNMEK
jgi:hypothetical protein